MQLETLRALTAFSENVAIIYFLMINTFYLGLLVAAARSLLLEKLKSKFELQREMNDSSIAPKVSVIATAFNEEAGVVDSVNTILALSYPNLEVVVVNDGSTDRTLDSLINAFDLESIPVEHRDSIEHCEIRSMFGSAIFPNLIVIDKQNGRKADALNAGLDVSSGSLVCAIDADTLVERDALQKLVQPFVASDQVVAAGGTLRVLNGTTAKHGQIIERRVPNNFFIGFQLLEYLRAFLIGRLGWNSFGGNIVISGAFGVFRRDAVIAIGGYKVSTVGEDVDLIVRLRRNSYHNDGPGKVVFIPNPVAWTEVPETESALRSQRERWHRGLAEVLASNPTVTFNPRYRGMGLVSFPYFLFVELLSPVFELIGLIAAIVGGMLGILDTDLVIAFVLATYVYSAVLTVSAILLEELTYSSWKNPSDVLKMLALSFLEPLGYRQLSIYWRLLGIYRFLRREHSWQ